MIHHRFSVCVCGYRASWQATWHVLGLTRGAVALQSWNEPDGECGADLKVGIKCNPDSFLSYFDACSNGLRSVDSQLVFGGPASDGANAFLADLITHCLTGKDRITGEQACTGNGRVDYLNAHKKGDESTAAVVDIELPVALHVKQVTEGSHLAGAAWGNDECDPKVGWSKEYPWRGDSRYAAMVPREVQQHLEVFIQEVRPPPTGVVRTQHPYLLAAFLLCREHFDRRAPPLPFDQCPT